VRGAWSNSKEKNHMETARIETSAGARSAQRNSQPVEFIFNQPEAKAVALAGSFNNWDPKRMPMRKDPSGKWHTTVTLSPGRHEYRFVADGQWVSDPNAKEFIKNSFGTTNSVMSV